MKRNGSAVFLVELLMVILFFSLSAAVTLRLFVSAYQQETASLHLSAALEKAQDTAELFRANGSSLFSSSCWESGDTAGLYQQAQGDYLLQVAVKTDESPAGVMESADIVVYLSGQPDGEPVTRLSVSRYTPTAEEGAP